MDTPTLIEESAQRTSPEIEAATKAYTFEFSIYVFLLVATALLVAFFTWRVGKASSNLQDAIRHDADARIAAVNERAQKLEQDNLKLRADVEARTTQLAVEQQKLEKEQQKTAQAQKEAAEAQLALQKHLDQVARRQRSRTIDGKTFVAALKGKPKAKVEILYRQDDEEAHWLAISIRRWLGPGQDGDGVGWDVLALRPIPSEGGAPGISEHAPAMVRYGASQGLGVWANRPGDLKDETSLAALVRALAHAVLYSNVRTVLQNVNPSLPDDFFIIVVGQKP